LSIAGGWPLTVFFPHRLSWTTTSSRS
jgi:hypothetical protein